MLAWYMLPSVHDAGNFSKKESTALSPSLAHFHAFTGFALRCAFRVSNGGATEANALARGGTLQNRTVCSSAREVSRVGVRCGKQIGRAIRREIEVYPFPVRLPLPREPHLLSRSDINCCHFFGFFLGMYLYRSLRGCSYGSRGFLEGR